MSTQIPRAYSILGVPLTPFEDYGQAVNCVKDRIDLNKKTFCVAINPEKVYCSRNDPILRRVLMEAHIGICDGIGAGLAAKILHGQYVPRCTGIGLFLKLVEASVEHGWGIFLFGASEEANEGTYKKLKEQYPGIRIVGRHNGFFVNDNSVIEQINNSKSDLLFVAIGSPRQELWIYKHMEQINAKFFLGVGGTFDVMSGRVKRAPKWIQRLGVEFFYRMCQFPTRWNRHHRRPLFALLVITEKIRQVLGLPLRG